MRRQQEEEDGQESRGGAGAGGGARHRALCHRPPATAPHAAGAAARTSSRNGRMGWVRESGFPCWVQLWGWIHPPTTQPAGGTVWWWGGEGWLVWAPPTPERFGVWAWPRGRGGQDDDEEPAGRRCFLVVGTLGSHSLGPFLIGSHGNGSDDAARRVARCVRRRGHGMDSRFVADHSRMNGCLHHQLTPRTCGFMFAFVYRPGHRTVVARPRRLMCTHPAASSTEHNRTRCCAAAR
jgi:hypothetical protein